jgi:hypothetical protein
LNLAIVTHPSCPSYLRLILLIIPEMVLDSTSRLPPNLIPEQPGCFPVNTRSSCPKITAPVFNGQKPFGFPDTFIGEGLFENSYFYFSGYRDNFAEARCPVKRQEKLMDSSMLRSTAFRFLLVALIIFIINSVYVSIQ